MKIFELVLRGSLRVRV